MLKRKDLSDDRDPNPDADRQYSQPELTESRVPGRSFPDTNVAADQRHQAETRNSGSPTRGNDTDDVQAVDRSGEAALVEGDADAPDHVHRLNAARTTLDAERRAAADPNNTHQAL